MMVIDYPSISEFNIVTQRFSLHSQKEIKLLREFIQREMHKNTIMGTPLSFRDKWIVFIRFNEYEERKLEKFFRDLKKEEDSDLWTSVLNNYLNETK